MCFGEPIIYPFYNLGQCFCPTILIWNLVLTAAAVPFAVFSEPIQWTDKSINMFKPFIDNADLFSIDLMALQKDGLIEAVYVSPAIRPNLDKDLPHDIDERLIKLASISDIDTSPVDWSVCDEKLGLRFAVVPYYLVVIKGGIIPPEYITLEK